MFPFHSPALGHGQGPPVHLVVGFQRHAVTVMLSHSFLVWLEWQQRQARSLRGPPRGAFPPRQDRRRVSLPEMHRYIIEWLRFEAIRELILLGGIEISTALCYFDKVVQGG